MAAVAIALFHVPFATSISEIPVFYHSPLLVDFFFVLSGFVLTHAHLHKNDTLLSFFVKRVGRLWPLHIVTLSAFVLLEIVKLYLDRHGVPSDQAPFTNEHSVYSLVTNIFLVQAMGLNRDSSWNVPAWTISTELWVSMLLCCFMLISRQRLGLMALATVFSSGVILFLVSPDPSNEIAMWAFFRTSYCFFAGVAVYVLCARLSAAQGGIWESPVLLLALTFMWFYNHGLEGLLTAPVFVLFVQVFAAEGGFISRLLKSPPIKWLGERSYSIYIVHSLILLLMWRSAKALAKHLPISFAPHAVRIQIHYGYPLLNDGIAAIYLVCVFALANATYAWIETPWRKKFNRWALLTKTNSPALS
jgi:peptidoglycan/LPS O-acetylase OafA/YrhL